MSQEYTIKISKEGFDVKTAADKDLIFNAATPSMNFIRSSSGFGQITFVADGTQTVAHGLGYIPTFMCFIKKSGETYWKVLYRDSGSQEAYSDNANLNIYAQTGDQVRYYIFFQPGETESGIAGVEVERTGIGFMLSRPGFDVKTCKAHELAFNSNWGRLMVQQTFDLAVEVTGAGFFSATSAHGLGYSPAFLAMIKSSTNIFPNPFVFADFSDSDLEEVRIDSTNITAIINTTLIPPSPITVNFKVHLFTEDLEAVS